VLGRQKGKAMSLWNLFQSKSEKERLSHIKNLIALTLADGKVDPTEVAVITAVASRENISPDKVKELMQHPDRASFVIPDSNDKKLEYLQDMVLLMMSDGDIDDKELALCKIVAIKFGYRHEVIDAMLLGIIADLKAKMNS